jgi:signal peptidase I
MDKLNRRQAIFEIIRFVLITLIIVVPIRTYIAQPFIVSGASMAPTFESGQYLIIDEVSYFFRSPERGEVIVFRFPDNPSKFFIKRIIGLPKETITIDNDGVKIKTDQGETFYIQEPYAHGRGISQSTIKLADNEYFVLGDNRPVSSDSRVWGPVNAKLIKGRAWLRLFPIATFDIHPGKFTNYQLVM